MDALTPGSVAGWLDRLHENGYRLTAPRQAVVDVVARSRYVLNPLEVFDQARQRYAKLGLVTVYRTLDKLEEVGLLQRVHQPSGCQGFIAAFRGHQHMLICQGCGRVEIFGGDLEKIADLLAEVEKTSGYTVQEHWLQLFGVCSECRGNGR
jgi:Fe2+ or Zn2+ uptake regulation protein